MRTTSDVPTLQTSEGPMSVDSELPIVIRGGRSCAVRLSLVPVDDVLRVSQDVRKLTC